MAKKLKVEINNYYFICVSIHCTGINMLCRTCKHKTSIVFAGHQTQLCEQCWIITVPLIKNKIRKCGICLSSLKKVQSVSTTPCEHVYCYDCFLHWGAHYCTENKDEPVEIPCPTCQTIIIPN